MPRQAMWLLCVTACLCGCSAQNPAGPVSSNATGSYRIGTWNLEYLHDDHARGFPEYFFGGPYYGPRGEADYAAIAGVIAEFDFAILVLQEVNAQPGADLWRSAELDRLTGLLGNHYEYVVGGSGHPQHVAILWDTRRVHADTVFEITYPEMIVDGEDLFTRDPLAARFRLIEDGRDAGDLLVVGLHLASGRANTRNHDSAFALLVDTLRVLVDAPTGLLTGEQDIIIAGDFNFDFFDADRELFVEQMELGPWDLLAGWNYACTRLGGVPLAPQARLDYLICTDAMRGSRGVVDEPVATVHSGLATGGYDTFRRVYSDHFPVSIRLRPGADDD